MLQIFSFLDEHNGSLMVLITVVYVIATIFICWANIKSAKMTKQQLEESKRQYQEEHRPYVSYQLIFENRTWYGMSFKNHGERIANHVQVKFDQDFLNSVNVQGVRKLQNTEFILGVGQSYEVFFGGKDFRNNPNKKPIIGEIIYQDAQTTYRETFNIDFERYATFYSTTSPSDNLYSEMKKLNQNLKNIVQILKNQQSNKTDSN